MGPRIQDSGLSSYGEAKVRAVLKMLDHKWEEACEKELLKPNNSQSEEFSKEIQIFDKDLVSWLKREQLDNKDLSNILERLKGIGIILVHYHAEFDEDEDRSTYFKKGYFLITLPVDYEEHVKQYLTPPPSSAEELLRREKMLKVEYRREFGPQLGWFLSILMFPFAIVFYILKAIFSFGTNVIGEIFKTAFKVLIFVIATLIVLGIVVYFIQPSIPEAILEHLLSSPILRLFPST